MSFIAEMGRGAVRYVAGALLGTGALALLFSFLPSPVGSKAEVWALIRDFLRVQGAVFLTVGGFVLIVTRWRSQDDFPEKPAAWTQRIVAGTVVLGPLAIAFASPAFVLAKDTISILEGWGLKRWLGSESGSLAAIPASCMLLVPAIEIAVALCVVLTPAVLISALRSGNQLFIRTFLGCVLLQAALVHAGYNTAKLTAELGRILTVFVGSLMQSAGTGEMRPVALMAWISRHQAVIDPVAEHMIWVVLLSSALLAVAYLQRHQAVQGEDDFGVLTHSIAMPSAVPAEYPNRERPVLCECFGYASYLLKGTTVTSPSYYPDAKVIFRLKGAVFGFGGGNVLYSADGQRTLLVVQKCGAFSSRFEIRVPPQNEVAAIVDGWSFTSFNGWPPGNVSETHLGLGFARYAVRVGGIECCTVTVSIPFRGAQAEIEFPPDGKQCFDPRIGLSLGIILAARASVRSTSD